VKLEYIAEGSQDCPLIRLYAFDQPGILRLREIAEALANGSAQIVTLHDQPRIEPIGPCELTLQSDFRDTGVSQIAPSKFECRLTPSIWENVKYFIDPFCEPGPGQYQWLSEQGKISLLLSKSGSW
jgi:hypothetical protein